MSYTKNKKKVVLGGEDEERLICLLFDGQGCLKPAVGSPNEQAKKMFLVVGSAGHSSRKSYFADRTLLKKCLSRGWLEKRDNTFVLTSSGRAAVQRLRHGVDGFRAQHQKRETRSVEISPGVMRSVEANEAESPLGWLRKRKDKNGRPLVNDAQFQAGERLAREFYLAQLSPRVTANWSALSSSRREKRSAPGAGVEMSLRALAAKERVMTALKAVGPELSGVLLDVCCFSQGLEMAEKKAGWPQRSAKVVLQLALTALARHYGILCEDPNGPIERHIEHWGANDYRPRLES